MSAPRVSVILPTYEREALLEASIRSVLDQSFEDFELIVVDDGSTDGTAELVRGIDDPRVRYLQREHAGIAAALNAGLRGSSGLYVARNDSDDLWLPDLLAHLVAVLDANPAAGLAYGRAQFMDEHEVPTPELRGSALRYPREPMRSLLYLDYTCSIASLYRRSVIAPIGGWDDSLVVGEDWDLALRTASQADIVFVDRVLARVRRHSGNITSSESPLLELRLERRRRVLDKVFVGSVPPGVAVMKSVAYRNLHIGESLELLGVGETKRALQAFSRAGRDGGSYSRALLRLVVGYATWRWGARFPGLMRKLSRAAASLRGRLGAARDRGAQVERLGTRE